MIRTNPIRPRRLLRALLVAAAACFAPPSPRALALPIPQCAMCKDYVYSQDNAEQGDRTSRAIYHSILGMLGVPLVLIGGLIALIVVNNRARARALARLAPDDTAPPLAKAS